VVGVVDSADALVAARLVVALRRLTHRRTGLLVGQLDLASVQRGEQATECVGLAGDGAGVGQSIGGEVFLDAGKPAEQLVAEDLAACVGGRSIGTTRGPAVGF
jgi:hypothetical protein